MGSVYIESDLQPHSFPDGINVHSFPALGVTVLPHPKEQEHSIRPPLLV